MAKAEYVRVPKWLYEELVKRSRRLDLYEPGVYRMVKARKERR